MPIGILNEFGYSRITFTGVTSVSLKNMKQFLNEYYKMFEQKYKQKDPPLHFNSRIG